MKILAQWEDFFNRKDEKSRLISRYIYEHLFSGQIFFPEVSETFFRMIRARGDCRQAEEIATRRPYDDPKAENFNYCFVRFNTGLLDKHKVVYQLSQEKKKRFEELFWKPDWWPTRVSSYDSATGSNPFVTFQEIPTKSRYQFLLDDSQYHTETFTKGNVCAGNLAVNSINEQFFVFFLKPESDQSVMDPEYYNSIAPALALPAERGSNKSNWAMLGNKFLSAKNEYRALRAEQYLKAQPAGPSLKDIWDGDGSNPNAVLTVLRHFNNAHVLKGFHGDVAKTIWVADYPLIERLVYNLVAGYDVYGNMQHQTYSRIYMNYLRMDGEENFLLFLPVEDRVETRNYWNTGGATTYLKMFSSYPFYGKDNPTAITFESAEPEREFVERILFNVLSDKARGELDYLNWKFPYPAQVKQSDLYKTPVDQELKKLTSLMARTSPYVRFFPDLSFLRVRFSESKEDRAYSIVRNKQMFNLVWIVNEDSRRDFDSDTLMVMPNFVGSYPNMFLEVEASKIKDFVKDIMKIKSENDYQVFLRSYGISSQSAKFWETFEWFNQKSVALDPVENGTFDLIRYGYRKLE